MRKITNFGDLENQGQITQKVCLEDQII